MNHLWLVLLIIFLSSLVQSTFSFGGALIALPLLAFTMDVKVATPLMTLLSCSISVLVVSKQWRDIHIKNAWRLIVSSWIGILLGIIFLVQVDARIVKLVLSVTVIVFTLINFISVKKLMLTNLNYAFGFGLVSGLFGGAYNMSGPPVVLYGSLVQWSPAMFRATIQSYALFTNLFAIAGYGLAGNLTMEVMQYALYALPVVGSTIWIGNRLHALIPGQQYQRYVRILLLILGFNLLYSTLR